MSVRFADEKMIYVFLNPWIEKIGEKEKKYL